MNARCESIDNHYNIVRLLSNNIFMVRTKVQNDKAKGKVNTFSYQVSEQFCVLKFLGDGNYIVQRYGKLLSREVRHMANDLYNLPFKVVIL